MAQTGRQRGFGVAVLTALIAGLGALARADDRPLRLALPLACEPHRTCFIQSYFDLDQSTGVRDYGCGTATYDGHNGVDFRLLSGAAARAGVAVLAAADGVVKTMRDGMNDQFADASSLPALAGRECGNGVVLDNREGWETQYCHMKLGSVRVKAGQSVARGDVLGEVGYSGAAGFAHVHLSVRHDGREVDPFLPVGAEGRCPFDVKTKGLWEPSAAAAFPYRGGEIIQTDLAGAPVDHESLEADHAQFETFKATSTALVVFARSINLVAGDRLRFVLNGPGGTLMEQLSAPVSRNKATFTSYAGKTRKGEPWPIGRYEGRVELVRDGGVIATAVSAADLR